MHDPLNLTFGVEIEFIVAFDPKDYEKGLSKGYGILWEEQLTTRYRRDNALRTLLRCRIVETLSRNGFPTYDVTSPEGDQKWTVTNDTSIITNDDPQPEGWLECDVEIKSPAMRLCPKALGRVNAVLSVLLPAFDTYVNASCGLHVHIGNQRAGFPLQTLKNLSMLTAMFEHQLNSFHPSERVDSLHAKGPSTVFRGQNPWDVVQTIQNCATKRQLLFLYMNEEDIDRNFAYNLCPMVVGPRKTIEFRQHEGTLDALNITNWIQVAGGLVNAMHEISGSELGRLISDHAFHPRYSAIDLLIRLKMGPLVPYYQGRLHAHLRPEPMWVPGWMGGYSEAAPRLRSGNDRREEMENRHRFELRWEEMENRHRRERFHEHEKLELMLTQLEELGNAHEFERRWEMNRRLGL